MRGKFNHRRSRLCTAVATATSAIGIVILPVPTAPVANAACEDWIAGPTAYGFTQNNGFVGDLFGWSGKSLTATPGGRPAYAWIFPQGGGPKSEGAATGNINGRAINFTINWQTGPQAGKVGNYTGTIDDNGIASGTAHGIPWRAHDALKCGAAPANPGAPSKTAFVTTPETTPEGGEGYNSVDVYDTPGGGGKVIGTVAKDKGVQVNADCQPETWCLIRGAAVPKGQGWIWGHLRFE
jgi:hypothetical protein